MKKLAIAATALVLAVVAPRSADSVLVLNSEEASYSILSRSQRGRNWRACRSAASRII